MKTVKGSYAGCMMRVAKKDTATVFKWEQGVTETKETEAGEIIAVKQICSKKLLKENVRQKRHILVTPVGRWFPAEAGETSAKQKLNLEWENDGNDPSGDQSKPSLTPTELAGHPFFKRALQFAQSWPPLSLDPRTKSGKT